MARTDAVNISPYYATHGRGAPLLMLMGLGGSSDSWGNAFTHPLARTFRLLLPDHRGTGRTPRGDAPYTIAQLARDALAVLDAERLPRAHVLGVSMGGMVAQELAIRYPDRVAGLVLGCTTAGGRRFVPPDPAVFRELQERGILGAPALVVTPEFAARHPERLARLGMQTLLRPTSPETWRLQLQAIAAFDVSDRLHQIAAQTLVITGDRDLIMPVQNSYALARGIRGATGVVVKGTGHCFFWEAPERAAKAIREFLEPLVIPSAA